MSKYIPAKKAKTNGTSLKGYVAATFDQLANLLGQPHSCDEYKTSTEWVLLDDEGSVFTIYDYKATNLYERSEPSVEEFRSSGLPYEWHIGGKKPADDLIQWLMENMGPVGGYILAVKMPNGDAEMYLFNDEADLMNCIMDIEEMDSEIGMALALEGDYEGRN